MAVCGQADGGARPGCLRSSGADRGWLRGTRPRARTTGMPGGGGARGRRCVWSRLQGWRGAKVAWALGCLASLASPCLRTLLSGPHSLPPMLCRCPARSHGIWRRRGGTARRRSDGAATRAPGPRRTVCWPWWLGLVGVGVRRLGTPPVSLDEMDVRSVCDLLTAMAEPPRLNRFKCANHHLNG